MKPLDKHYLSLQFKIKIHSKSGSEFQRFFENIMEEVFDEFRKVPSGGGDGGNDGWIRSIGRYYQVYSPDMPATKDSEAAKKLKEDFDKLKRNWEHIAEIKEYYFVYNDKYAGAKKPEDEISNLRTKNPTIKFYLLLAKDLEAVFFQLDESKILALGFNIDQRLAISNGFEYLQKVEKELDRSHAKYAFSNLEDVKNIISTLGDELLLEYKILECRCLQKLERTNEAIDMYLDISKIYTNDPRALLYLSEIYLTQDDTIKNKELLEKAREIDSDFWLLSLEDLIRKNYLNEEIDVSNIDERAFPDSHREKSIYYRVFSSIFEKLGDRVRANSFNEKAIYFNPDRFANYVNKLVLTLNTIYSQQDSLNKSANLQKLLTDIDEVDKKFSDYGGIGPRNKAILNSIRLHIFYFFGNTQEYEKVAEETLNLLLNCNADKQVQQIFCSFLQVVSIPTTTLEQLLNFLKCSRCDLIEDLSTALIFQFNIHRNLFTIGKKFFKDKNCEKYYTFIINIEDRQYDKVLCFLKQNINLAFIMAKTLYSFPKLRKKIIENFPDDNEHKTNKLLLLLSLYVDDEDFDEAFKILKTIDLNKLDYFQYKNIFQIVKEKKAWDFAIVIINKLLEKEHDEKQIIILKLELFNAASHLQQYNKLIDLGENILNNYFNNGKLKQNDEYVLSNTIIACIQRGKVDNNAFKRAIEILQQHQLAKPSFEFKVGIEAEAYLHNNQPEKALESLIDGIRLKKVLSSTEYAKLYFTLFIKISAKINLELESKSVVTKNSFVKLQSKDDWYFIGERDELDAIIINNSNIKYHFFLDKKLGEQIVFEDTYSFGDEERIEIIEKIFPIEKYILWKTIHNFNKLTQDGDLSGVQRVMIPQKNETIDPQYLLKFLENLHSRNAPFFKLYCKNNNIPLAMLAANEGGIISAISKIQREQKGYINFSDGSTEDFENQKIKALNVIKNQEPFHIDATSALFLSEIGLLSKIITYIPGLKVPQSVLNFLADICEKFRYTEGQTESMGYVQGKIFISSLEIEKSNLIRFNFLKSIEVLESNPENVRVISEANQIECFPEIKIPAELCDAYSLAQMDNTSVLTDDPLYLKMVALQTNQSVPKYFSSLALIRVLYEEDKISFDEYLDFFGYLSSYRFRFLSLSVDDIEKAVFGDKQINVININNINKFNFHLVLSEEYGVNFNMAILILSKFIFNLIIDNSIVFDIKIKILFEITNSFPTDLRKSDLARIILNLCSKEITNIDKSLVISINAEKLRLEVDKLLRSFEIFGSEIKLWRPGGN